MNLSNTMQPGQAAMPPMSGGMDMDEPLEQERDDGMALSKLRRQFEQYASAKSEEIDEFRLSHRYYSGLQYSTKDIATLNKRGQPVITFNRISRKIDGVVGTIRKLRTDPKAYPCIQGKEQDADLATQVVRYLCDASDFESIESDEVLQCAIIGYAGVEMMLDEGAADNPVPGMTVLDSRTIFYDPRSVLWNFADARFMGTYKWATPEEIDEIAPGFGEKVKGASDGTFSTQAETDRDNKWNDEHGRVKLVDHWYIERGRWKWCLHAGSIKIDSGDSPFFDENGKSICKFRIWSAYIDQDGDRYGFVRNMKGPQDAMNQHRSKAMHIMNTRQVKFRNGAIANVAQFQIEASKPNGMLKVEGDMADVEIIQPQQEFIQQTQYFQDAKNEIENFGPTNPALVGGDMAAKSGRALAMLQQAGLAELGPFLKNYRMAKLDKYKCLWGAAKVHMKAEQWLRVTGDEKVAQFIQINQLQMDPYGYPVIINQLGAIDVDIVLDEGPDTETVMGDTFDALQAMANNSVPIPPQVLIEMSNLPGDVKERLTEMLQPKEDPMKQANDQALVQQEVEKATKLQAEAFKITMDGMLAQQQLMMGGMQQQQPQAPAAPPPMDAMPEPMQEAPQGPDMGMMIEALISSQQQNGQMMAEAVQNMGQNSQMLSQAILQQGEMTQSGFGQLASALMAPTQSELIRDPQTGRATASRSYRVQNEMVN